MSKWIRKDDEVMVISGNDKGKMGKVLFRKEDRVVVQGINVRKKHMKRTSEQAAAQIVSIEMPIHISNVQLVSKDKKPVRLKALMKGEEKVLVYFDKTGKEVEYRKVKSK